MQRTYIALFDNRPEAEIALEALEAQGFNPKDMSIIMKDITEARDVARGSGANALGGVASGATTGAIVGGLAGLLIGVGAIAIPGIGAVLIGGPLAAALGLTGAVATTAMGAATGAVAGGLLGALVELGLPENEAVIYENRIKEGAILLAVPISNTNENMAREILEDAGAERVRIL